DRNRSHWSTSKTPSYTKSVSWQHHHINHNFATESEARQALNEETDAQGATYYHVILMREPGSNGNMHASADIYR
ncbi:DUF1471 domain-containing protein, partial [Escherichia coli]